MTTYIIQVSVGLILFYGTYAIFLKQETSFRLIRYFLLFSLLASALLPFIDAGQFASFFIEETDSIFEYWLPDITTSAIQVTNQNVASNLIWEIIVWIYFTGVTVSTLRLLLSIFKLRAIINRSKIKQDSEGWYYLLEDRSGSFSFFNYVFIGSKSWYSEGDKQSILTHERVHTRNWHSADVIVVQLLAILVWFNPVIYWYRKTLEELHEYEADGIASIKKTEEYCGLLAKDVLLAAQLDIANHFNKSLTLKRITMIQSMKRKMSISKKIGLIGTVLLLVIVMACEEKVISDMKKAAGQSVLLTEYPKEVQEALNTIKANNPDAKLQVYGVVKTADLEQIDLKGKIATMFFRENDPDYKAYLILGADDVSFASSNLFEMKAGEKIYSIVQEPASPVNGMTDFYKYVAANLKYPEQARKMGIEGRVFLKFLVDETGKLSSIEIVRGIGAGCDEEAKRILSNAPNWKPGMQDGIAVKSIFNLVIIFKLMAAKEG